MAFSDRNLYCSSTWHRHPTAGLKGSISQNPVTQSDGDFTCKTSFSQGSFYHRHRQEKEQPSCSASRGQRQFAALRPWIRQWAFWGEKKPSHMLSTASLWPCWPVHKSEFRSKHTAPCALTNSLPKTCNAGHGKLRAESCPGATATQKESWNTAAAGGFHLTCWKAQQHAHAIKLQAINHFANIHFLYKKTLISGSGSVLHLLLWCHH